MRRAGFALVGGMSTRMGVDKAVLPVGAGTLLESIASKIALAGIPVALIGDPKRYSQFNYPVYADRVPGCGPLGGLETALRLGLADWNLAAACDLPGVTSALITSLFERAEQVQPELACIVPVTAQGVQPLCAVYHQSCLPVVERALAEGRFKMRALLSELSATEVFVSDPAVLANVNTPAQWARFQAGQP